MRFDEFLRTEAKRFALMAGFAGIAGLGLQMLFIDVTSVMGMLAVLISNSLLCLVGVCISEHINMNTLADRMEDAEDKIHEFHKFMEGRNND
jgi:hypothetical protein